jgi:hypothetical protein
MLTRGAGDSIKPGVERSGTPGSEPRRIQARGSGRQSVGMRFRSDHYPTLHATGCHPLPRVQTSSRAWSWGSAALHPRLYAVARSAG